MSDREIKLAEVLKDIRRGAGKAALMRKYRLSERGLQDLYRQLAELGLTSQGSESDDVAARKTVKVKEFVIDFRAGMTDAALMAKYQISRASLDYLYQRLVEVKALKPESLLGRGSLRTEAVMPSQLREFEWLCLDFELPIFEAGNPAVRGRVKDITEKGVGTVGIRSHRHEVLTLAIKPDVFLGVEAFTFTAECRWCRYDDTSDSFLAGFQFTEITESDSERLKTLLELLVLCE